MTGFYLKALKLSPASTGIFRGGQEAETLINIRKENVKCETHLSKITSKL